MANSVTVLEYPRFGSHPDTWDQSFSGTCPNGHPLTFTVDELDDALWELQNLECLVCGDSPLELEPEEVRVECPFCRESESVSTQLATWAGHRCYGGRDSDALQAVGSSSYFQSLLHDFYETEADPRRIQRTRVDHWDLVTHFTTVDAFVSILRSKSIEARPTGYFASRRHPPQVRAQSRAVCFTETPHEFVHDLAVGFGSVGFCFRKSDLHPLGLAPTVNLPVSILRSQRTGQSRISQGCRDHTWVSGLHHSLLPYVNKYDPVEFPYSHEREWRVPRDISLATVRPWLYLPDEELKNVRNASRDGGVRELVEWLCSYGRITTHQP